MPACMSDLIKGQNNRNSSGSRVVKKPCLFCKVEHLEGIFRKQMSKAKISGVCLPGSCGEGRATGLWIPCLLGGHVGGKSTGEADLHMDNDPSPPMYTGLVKCGPIPRLLLINRM